MNRRRNVTLLALCQGLMMTGNVVSVATSALVGAALAPDPSLATLPLAVQFLVTMVATFPASFLMGRLGRRAGFLLGAVLGLGGGALATMAVIASSFALFVPGVALVGVFNAFGGFYRFAAADAADDEHRGRAISYVLAGGVAAAFVGPYLARWSREWLSTLFAGSYAAMALMSVLTLVVLPFLDIPRPTPQERSEPARPLAMIARQPEYLTAVVAAMLSYGAMTLVMSVTPLAMEHNRHTFGEAALVIQWHVVGMFAPAFVTGHLIRRFGSLTVMLWGGVLAAGCVAVNLTGTGVGQFWAALVLLGVGWNFLFVGATTLLTDTYTPGERSKAQALNDFLVYTTVALATLSAGMLQEALGWRAVNLAAAPMLAVILASLAWLRVTRPRRPTPLRGHP